MYHMHDQVKEIPVREILAPQEGGLLFVPLYDTYKMPEETVAIFEGREIAFPIGRAEEGLLPVNGFAGLENTLVGASLVARDGSLVLGDESFIDAHYSNGQTRQSLAKANVPYLAIHGNLSPIFEGGQLVGFR